jgi:hypothetical protein
MYVDFVRVYQKGTSDEEFYSKAKTSVPALKSAQKFSIYPVPSKNFIKIKGESTPANIDVRNMNGQLVASYTNCNEISTEKLVSGNYILVINANETHTFVKN